VWLFDEAQDFSPLELQLANQWAAGADTAVIVADPDQAIYGWRGADPNALYRLHLAGQRVLEQSHRVPQTAHHVAGHWISQLHDRKPITYRPTDIQGVVERSPHCARVPETWLDQIRTDLDQGLEVMVLTSCCYMLQPLISVLRRHGIPFHNPYRPERGQWNPMRGARRLKAFLRPNDHVWPDGRSRLWTWQDLHDWTEPLKAKTTLVRGAKTLIENKIAPDRFGDSQADHEVAWDTLLELLGTTDHHHPAIQLDTNWWETNLLASQRKTAEYPLQVLRHTGPAGLATEPRLCIGTVHSVKGGQADAVYIAPDLSLTGMESWANHGPGRDQIVRLFYVAITRARRKVVVLAPSGPTRIPVQLLGIPDPALEQAAA
jgi:DNA helicase-2/ATP-dependent DNA helicase PcrA